MNILFIGNHIPSHSTETHHRKTFEKMGHTVIQIQENNTSIKEISDKFVDVDLVYWTHTHSFRFGEPAEVVKLFSEIKELVPVIGYHLDLWLGLERQKDLSSDPYWMCLTHFFSVDKLMADWLNEHTAIKGYYLPPGVYEDECYIAEPDRIKYPHDIVFTGSKGYHKEYPYRGILIDWLQKTYGDKFAHYGGGGLPGLRGHELNTLYASAKVVVGDTLCKGFDYPYYFSDRLPETTGRGGFLIFPFIKGVEIMYDLGRELIAYKYGDFEDLKVKIDYYLNNDEKREELRLAGHKRAKASHTYTQRLSHIMETLNIK